MVHREEEQMKTDRVATTRRRTRGEVQEDGDAEGRRGDGEELGHDPRTHRICGRRDSAQHPIGRSQQQEKGPAEGYAGRSSCGQMLASNRKKGPTESKQKSAGGTSSQVQSQFSENREDLEKSGKKH